MNKSFTNCRLGVSRETTRSRAEQDSVKGCLTGKPDQYVGIDSSIIDVILLRRVSRFVE